MSAVCGGWVVLNKDGDVKRYAFGAHVSELVVATKREAHIQARALAERDDEIKSGDPTRWEFGRMPMAEVWRRGYKVRPVKVVLAPKKAA